MAQDVPVMQWTNKELVSVVPSRAFSFPVVLAPSTSYPANTIIAALTATPNVYAVYNGANSDGSQNAEAVLPRAYITDAAGNVYQGNTVGGEYQISWNSVTAYFGGVFVAADVGSGGTNILNANALTKLGARLIKNGVYVEF